MYLFLVCSLCVLSNRYGYHTCRRHRGLPGQTAKQQQRGGTRARGLQTKYEVHNTTDKNPENRPSLLPTMAMSRDKGLRGVGQALFGPAIQSRALCVVIDASGDGPSQRTGRERAPVVPGQNNQMLVAVLCSQQRNSLLLSARLKQDAVGVRPCECRRFAIVCARHRIPSASQAHQPMPTTHAHLRRIHGIPVSS